MHFHSRTIIAILKADMQVDVIQSNPEAAAVSEGVRLGNLIQAEGTKVELSSGLFPVGGNGYLDVMYAVDHEISDWQGPQSALL